MPRSDIGRGQSLVAFFRSLGGAIGVSVLGALLGQPGHLHCRGLAAIGVVTGRRGAGAELPNPATLPQPIREVVQDAFGHGIGDVFLAATPFAILAFLAVIFIKEVGLQTKSAIERDAETAAAVPAEPAVATASATRY